MRHYHTVFSVPDLVTLVGTGSGQRGPAGWTAYYYIHTPVTKLHSTNQTKHVEYILEPYLRVYSSFYRLTHVTSCFQVNPFD